MSWLETARALLERQRATLLAWLLLGAMAAIFFYIHASFVQDDAFITYRYARNLAQGAGFVYNAGEHVLGTTTPLFTLILAGAARVTRLDVVTVSLGVGLLSLWIGAGTLYQLGRAQSASWGLALALLYVTNPLLSQFVGMESYFLVCLLLLAVWAYASQRRWLAGLLCGLLVLVRYEMGLLLVVLAVIDFRAQRRPPYWLLPVLAVITPWLIYAWLQFGSPVPLSAAAKLAATRVPFALGAVLYTTSFIYSFRPAFVIIVLFVAGGAASLVLRRVPRPYAPVVLFGLLYFAVAAFAAGSFPWYYAPLVPAFAVLVTYGAQVLAELPGAALSRWTPARRQWLAQRLFWIIAAGALAIQLVFWRNDAQLVQRQAFDHRYVPFREAAQWLNQHAAPHQTLAAFEIGYIGYFTDMPIIDLAGLVTPGLFPWVKDGSDVTLTQCLARYAPDFVLIPSDDRAQIVIMGQDPRYQLEQEFEQSYRVYVKTG